jgi:hypothetical protein
MKLSLLRLSALAVLSAAAACSAPAQDDAEPSTAQRQSKGDTTAADCSASKSVDGWCWGMANHPNGSSRVHAFAEDDAWMATGSDVVAHWDGTTWTPMKVAGGVVSSLWGVASNDLYAAGYEMPQGAFGQGVVRHWDGKTWKIVATSPKALVSVWGSGPNDIYAGGWGFSLLHFDGTSWQETATKIDPTLSIIYQAIDGTGPDDVWVASNNGDGGNPLRHFDGTTWTHGMGAGVGTVLAIKALRAFAKNDVWAGGDSELRHFDGTAWTSVAIPDHKPFNGKDWEIHAIAGKAANDVYIALDYMNGGTGRLYHWNGTSMAEVTDVPIGDARLPPIGSLSFSPAGTMWLTRGANDILRRTETGAKGFEHTTAGPQTDFTRAASNGASVVGVGRSGHITMRGPSGWETKTAITRADGSEPWLMGVALPSPDVIVAAGPSDFVKVTAGVPETSQPWKQDLGYGGGPSVSATSADDVWIALDHEVWHRVGAAWAQIATPPMVGYVGDVLAVGPNEVYLATDGGLFKYDRGAWTKLWDVGVRHITKAADGTLWGAQAGGRFNPPTGLLVKDGVAFPLSTDLGYRANGVTSLASCPDGRVYAVGGYGAMLAWDGTSWREDKTGAPWGLAAVTCGADNVAWAFGRDGIVVKKAK